MHFIAIIKGKLNKKGGKILLEHFSRFLILLGGQNKHGFVQLLGSFKMNQFYQEKSVKRMNCLHNQATFHKMVLKERKSRAGLLNFKKSFNSQYF